MRSWRRSIESWVWFAVLALQWAQPAHADAARRQEATRLMQAGEPAKAVPLLEAEVLELTQTSGERDPLTLTWLNLLAVAYRSAGRAPEALPLHERILKLRTEALGERNPATLNSMNILGATYRALGRLNEQLALNEKVVRVATEVNGERHPATLNSMAELASTYGAVGRYSDAVSLQEKVLMLRTETLGERNPQTLRAMYQLAGAYSGVGRRADSLALKERVLNLRSEVLGERHADTLESMQALAEEYRFLGRPADALTLAERVMKLRIDLLGSRHPQTLRSMNFASVGYTDLGRITEGVALSEKAVALHTEVLGLRNSQTLNAMNNLASSYTRLGRHAEALALFEKVLASSIEVLGERHPQTLFYMSNVAGAYGALGRFGEQLPWIEKALRVQTEVMGDRHPNTLNMISTLALTLGRLQRGKEAASLTQRYIDGAEWQRGQPGLSGDNRRSLFQGFAVGYRLFSFYNGMTGNVAEGFRLTELSKARTLLDGMTAQRAARSGALPANEQVKLDTLNAQILDRDENISQAQGADEKQLLEARRNELVRQYDTLVARLRTEYPRYAQLSEPRLVQAKDLPGLVPANAVAVSYVTWGTVAAAWLVDASGQPRFVNLGSVPNLADAVETLRRVASYEGGLKELLAEEAKKPWRLSDGSYRLLDANAVPPQGAVAVTDEAEVATWLSDKLLKPLQPQLKGKGQWIISPDGPLAQLPFELLTIDGQRVLDAVELHYIQSLSVYALAQARQKEYQGLKRPKDLLALGNPEYEASNEPARTRKAKLRGAHVLGEDQLKDTGPLWSPLPGTEAEVKAIRRQLPNSDAYMKQEASEARLQQLNNSGELKNYRYLHFAVHGNLSTQDPALSSLVLSQKNIVSGTDGYVTASEWPGYDLRSDLTVLSACETGLGQNLSGEGVMGLPFALFVAGNVNTVLSLWPVFDDVTPVFMEKFFARLKAGRTAAKALTETKREMASNPKTKHPANWAPFVLVGAGG